MGGTVPHPPEPFCLLAEFDDADALFTAASEARRAGYTRLDAYTPFPVEGLAETLGFGERRPPWIALAGGLIGGIGGYLLQWGLNAVDYPTRQAFVMEMVGPKDLRNAIALNSSLVNVTRLAGPAVAGALVERSGLGTTFWLNAASYLAVIWALLAMREHELYDVPTPARGRVLAQIREGVAYSIRSREICWLPTWSMPESAVASRNVPSSC